MKIALIALKSTFLEEPMMWGWLGLFYLASRLESMGHAVDYFDMNIDQLPKDGEFDYFFISATSPQMFEIKKIANDTMGWKTKRILGGASVWANPESCKDLGFDLIVGGESDEPNNMQRILDAIENPPENKYLLVPVSKTLDWVLSPSRRWMYKYHSYMLDQKTGIKHEMASLFTSRGCPMECAYCESGRHGVIWDRLTRYEPLHIVEQQIKECVELGYTGLAYYDDILPLNKKRTLEILQLHKKYNIVWRCFLRSDIICNHGGKEYLQMMRDAGLIEIFVGIESADNKIKEAITKKTTIEQDELIMQWCRELGITMKASFILGLPSESMESMNKTRDWILKQDPNGIRIQVGRLIPFSGTPLINKAETYDLQYEKQLPDEWFYRGKHDLNTRSFVSTSHLTVDQIDSFWKKLNLELEERGFNK